MRSPLRTCTPSRLAGSVAAYFAQQEAGAVGSLQTYSVGMRLSNALVSYVVYLRRTLWPSNLSLFYSHPLAIPAWKAAGAAAILGCVSFVAVRAFRRRPAVLVGWLWFLLTLPSGSWDVFAAFQICTESEVPLSRRTTTFVLVPFQPDRTEAASIGSL